MSDSATQILTSIGPSCRDTGRRARLLAQTALNGIDFVEFEEIKGPPEKHVLHVHFLIDVPVGAYGLPLDTSKIRIHGGTRITGIAVTGTPTLIDSKTLDIGVDQQGDFSPYLLSIGWTLDDTGVWQYDFAPLDRPFSVAPINFRPGCPVDFDCTPVSECPPDALDEPALDYLARDYASFRQMLIDLVAQRNQSWIERSPADVGMALLELFAYEGDHLSYFQDAVANETFLDTARQRVSAKRHAKLIDYQMHDGRNAWAFVHIRVDSIGTIGPGIQLLTRITSPMRFDRQPGVVPPPQPTAPPLTLLNPITYDDYLTDPALAQVRVFETAATANLDPLNNELGIHTWGNDQCCLPRGRTSAHVYAIDATGIKAAPIVLLAGDYLLFEELLGPETGAEADANPTHRQVVQLERVNPDLHDPLFLADLDPTTKQPKPVTAPVPLPQTLPLAEVTWRKVDALSFPLCLSTKLPNGSVVHRISVARGNIALADHGRSIVETPDLPAQTGGPTFSIRVAHGPLTMQCPGPADVVSGCQPSSAPTDFPPIPERTDLTCDVRAAQPGVAVQAFRAGVPQPTIWRPVPDLLSSTEFELHFVADVDDVGRAVLRFGDGEYGASFSNIVHANVWYRVGNGRDGMVGAEAIAHIAVPYGPPLNWPSIASVRNPLPAQGGVDPELIEEVRQYAPAAFRARQLRAVTEQDYMDLALTIPGVAGARASFRWTGSWYTVFVGINPADPQMVITGARGLTQLDPFFKQQVLDSLTSYRLGGYDLEIRSARFIPLDIAIQVCVKPSYFRGDVAHAVALALGSGLKGLFYPANLTFGQAVYLSRIYAAVESVEGVESATVNTFHPHGHDAAGELERGQILIGPWEIARLDNDPNHMENGTLTITAGGGS